MRGKMVNVTFADTAIIQEVDKYEYPWNILTEVILVK